MGTCFLLSCVLAEYGRYYLSSAKCGLYFCLDFVWPCLAVLSLSGLAVGGFESLPLCGFIYTMSAFKIFFCKCVLRVEKNMSSHLIPVSSEVFHLLVLFAVL